MTKCSCAPLSGFGYSSVASSVTVRGPDSIEASTRPRRRRLPSAMLAARAAPSVKVSPCPGSTSAGSSSSTSRSDSR